jgi:LytR cell envelope-related transcriptional attenuator
MPPWMTSILALSVTGKIEQYGAYAGFAAVLGLAVLSLLYFAQAREVKRLREWAGRAPERAADLQERVQSSAQQRVVAQPQVRPAGAQPAVPGGARPAAATPAGQAQAAPGVAPAAAAAATAAGAATATPGAPAPPAGTPAAPGAAQPTTVQPAANGASAAPQPLPGQPLRVPPSAATPPPPRSGSVAMPQPERHGRSIWAIVGAAVALVAVGLVVAFVVLGGGDGDKKAANTIGTPGAAAAGNGAKASTGASATPAATPKPGTYTVAVLNGTAVAGLARGVAIRLQNTKFRIGNVTNAADQSRSATLVEYAPGHLAEAQAVAKAIDVGKDAIQAVDPGSRAIAGEQASVVVIVGSDQNTSPQQSQP